VLQVGTGELLLGVSLPEVYGLVSQRNIADRFFDMRAPLWAPPQMHYSVTIGICKCNLLRNRQNKHYTARSSVTTTIFRVAGGCDKLVAPRRKAVRRVKQ
jgi:hypothetical protein